MTEAMEQYMSKSRGDYGSGVTRPKINTDTHFELKGQFLKELRDNTFSGSEHEDANEHIKKVLEIVDLFHILNITQDQIMLRAFPVSLTGAASRWLKNESEGLILTWEKVILFYNKMDVPTRQILHSKGVIPTKTAANAKIAIQEMAEYSQKWHNGTSRTRSTKTSNGLAAIQLTQYVTCREKLKGFQQSLYIEEETRWCILLTCNLQVVCVKPKDMEKSRTTGPELRAIKDAIRRILGFGIRHIDYMYRPCCNKIDELVIVYSGKRCMLNSYGHSDASSTHFCSRTQIRGSSRAKYQGRSISIGVVSSGSGEGGGVPGGTSSKSWMNRLMGYEGDYLQDVQPKSKRKTHHSLRQNLVNEVPEPKKKAMSSMSDDNKLFKSHSISSTKEDMKT
ncbi:hypothetical protein Tco_0714415 [Tanacetum coccineum]